MLKFSALRIARGLLGPTMLVLATTNLALAEGSDEFDVRDGTYGGNADDQNLMTDTTFYVDIANGGHEQICFSGSGSGTERLRIYRPVFPNTQNTSPAHDTGDTTLLTSLTTGTCTSHDALDGVTGAYMLQVSTQQTGNWDIRVCPDPDPAPVTNDRVEPAECLSGTTYELPGRLWAYRWHLSADSFAANQAANGSVYAVVPGGDVGRNAVIEMRMDRVAGYDYLLFANSIGPETTAGVRVGRSVSTSGHKVEPEFRLYLNPPEAGVYAQYDWIEPQVGSVVRTTECGQTIVLNKAPGSVTFTSNIEGQYVLICDANGTGGSTGDGIFDFASPTDFSSFGTAVINHEGNDGDGQDADGNPLDDPNPNKVFWDGKRNDGTDVPAGDYECVIRLNVGEFHYIAEDIETSYPGFRMYRIEADRTTRTPIRMFWDDNAIGADSETMNGQAGRYSPLSPIPAGLDPTDVSNAASAFYYIGGTATNPNNGTPNSGNARAWGNFDGDGKGNNTFLDTFAAAATMTSPPFIISVIDENGDFDGDTVPNDEECDDGTDPQNEDTDGDGVRDDVDEEPLDPNACHDDDGDNCDDCALTGADGSGGDPLNDGDDFDGDDLCDDGDDDDDNDGVPDDQDEDQFNDSICEDVDLDGCNDCARGQGANPADDGEDNDGDGACDTGDPDDDNDGVADTAELGGADLSRDQDDNGIPDYRDADVVSCDDAAPQDGVCDSLPEEVDADQDGLPNHHDRDADGDGLTDARESGGTDANGDGQPDACLPLQADGRCASGLVTSPQNTDAPANLLPDLLDLDSDGDGIDDHVEAFDDDRDGLSDHAASGDDGDGDGIDDAFDPDCQGGCSGVTGRPVLAALTAAQDEDQDGIPDWLEACGDAYVTGSEVCDDADPLSAACNDTCTKLGLLQPCTDHAQCESNACDALLGTCQSCVDDQASTTDLGCGGAMPHCTDAGGTNACVACLDDQGGDAADLGCGGATPVCDPATNTCATCLDAPGDDDLGCSGTTALCDTAGNGGLGACVACLGDVHCDDGNECTADSCSSGSCGSTPLAAGTSCGGGSGVCDGQPAAACVTCVDDAAGAGTDAGCGGATPLCDTSGAAPVCVACFDDQSGTATDLGCAADAPLCDTSGAAPACVECFALTDCPLGQYCTASNTCAPGCAADSDCVLTPATPLCDTADSLCVECLADDHCPGIELCLASNTCSPPDSDGDGVHDQDDADDDNDGVADDVELGGTDLSLDSDGDGFPDYRDPDAVTCTDAQPDGDCDELPQVIDPDADGIPNHLDRDADGDGLTDAREAGGQDDDGDGLPDGCTSVDASGICASGSIAIPINTDDPADTTPDFLDVDSDGDGIDDHVEAFDDDRDGLSDHAASGDDGDGDGIDDAFDPDCQGGCSGVTGTPVLAALTAAQDEDQDGTPDWLQLCGDAYVTLTEACDDAGDPDPACSDRCLFGTGESCSGDGECDSALCDGSLGTCQACVDDAAGATDSGCTGPLPTCSTVNGTNVCLLCADDATGLDVDDGCSASAPLCDSAAASGAGACVECLAASDCSDGNECTSESCTAGTCGSTVLAAGTSCGTGVCDGASTPACVPCIDDAAAGAADSGCSGGTPVCSGSGSAAMCIGCAVDGDCGTGVCVGQVCRACEDDQSGSAADHGCGSGAPFCTGASGSEACVECLQDGHCPGGYCQGGACMPGCAADAHCTDAPATPFCAVSDHACVECLTDAHCDPYRYCSASFACTFEDSDGDGLPDDVDVDDDGDGITDDHELGGEDLSGDQDGDGIPDYVDPDAVTCDGAASAGECEDVPAAFDADGDGVPNHLDLDADEDGIPDATEGHDEDLDGEPDREPADADADGDGLDDAFDADCRTAAPCGGVIGMAAPRPDTDGDGAPNFLDGDDDGDGRDSRDERNDAAAYDGPAEDADDVDGDGARNWYDTDSDGDLAGDREENRNGGDLNEDGLPDYLDPLFRAADTDGDGVLDVDECPPPAHPDNGDCPDTDGDGDPDFDDTDDDGDGIPTRDERDGDSDLDTDDDGTPNRLDPDDDGDGIPTEVERGDGDTFGDDVDGDGTPNHLDPDSDGDGTPDHDEADRDDDDDGVPDYLEQRKVGRFAGGALCSIADPPHSRSLSGGAFALFIVCAALGCRRARHHLQTRNLRTGR